jgi:phage head maturation protease
MQMEYRNSVQAEVRVRDKTAGILEARTNQLEVVDDYDSVFASGFWDGVVARTGKMPKILVDHEGRRAGRVIETKEVRSAAGLFQHSVMQYNLGSRYGSEAWADILDGTDDEFSHGFVTAKQRSERRDGKNIIVKEECRMWPEVSQVLAGASPGTGPISIRSLLSALALPELRAMPMSQMQADCPYCSGQDGATEADCNCGSDCGAGNCPQASDTTRTSPFASGTETPAPETDKVLAATERLEQHRKDLEQLGISI